MFESIEIPLLLISVVAGALIGIPTGPANFFIVDTFMKDGRFAAIKVYGGLVSAKLIYAVLALLANGLITANPDVESIVYVLASFVLMGWGFFIIYKSKKETKSSIQLNINSKVKTGFVLGISNPAVPFVHLAFVQILNAYGQGITLLGYAVYITIFEVMTLIVLLLISYLLLIKKEKILNHWPKVKMGMGVLIICIGIYHIYQRVEIKDGIRLVKKENALKKNIDELDIGE